MSTCVALLPPMLWLLSQLLEFLALPEVLISLQVRTFLALGKSMKTLKDPQGYS